MLFDLDEKHDKKPDKSSSGTNPGSKAKGSGTEAAPISQAARKRAPKQDIVQGKLFYLIGEVSQMLDLEAYVLRYWETEFPQLRPKKDRSGQRKYRAHDIALLEEIKRLLYEEKYTIEGARRQLHTKQKDPSSKKKSKAISAIKKEIEIIKKTLG